MPFRSVSVPALVMKGDAPSTSTVPQWWPEIPGTYLKGEPFALPAETTDDQIKEWIEKSGGALSKTTATVKVPAEKPLAEYTTEELDEEYGGRSGYPAEGKKAEKLAFAQAAESAPAVPGPVEE